MADIGTELDTRPRLLDLFAGEGGAAYGYMLAGFDVTAVDDQDRPARAPGITWVTGDATTYPLAGFDVVTGSPPCTDKTTLRTVAEVKRKGGGPAGTGWMLAHTIDRFQASGLPYVIENVMGAREEMPGAFKLCGSMFDLTDEGWLLRRHRLFLSNRLVMAPGPCRCHRKKIIGVYGELVQKDRRCAGKRLTRPNGDMRAGVDRARRLMGMPWASAEGLPLAIPPAYTRWIGDQLLTQLPVLVGGCPVIEPTDEMVRAYWEAYPHEHAIVARDRCMEAAGHVDRPAVGLCCIGYGGCERLPGCNTEAP